MRMKHADKKIRARDDARSNDASLRSLHDDLSPHTQDEEMMILKSASK